MRTRMVSLAEWRDQIGQHVVHLDFKPRDEVPFRADLHSIFNHEGMRVARAITTPGKTFRDAALTKLGQPSYDMLIAQGAPCEIEHLGRDIRLRPGDAAILQNWEPGSLGGPSSTAYISVVLPVKTLASVGLRAPTAARVIPRGNEVLRLLRAYIRILETEQTACSGQLSNRIVHHIAELALAASGACDDREYGPTVAATRMAAVMTAIDERFADPNLNAAKVAAALGISVRYVDRLLEPTGKSFGRHLLERRLEAARDGLLSRSTRGRRVSDIALSCGFSDVSYFTRCFRARFGATPGSVRD